MPFAFTFEDFLCVMADANETAVGELLGPTQRVRIVVPQFQRGYEWKPEHVEAFWTDIIDFKKQIGLRGSLAKHFFGPVVVLKHDTHWDLLDGQQRLATTTILLSVIRDVAGAIPTTEASNFAHDTQSNYILKQGGDFALQLSEIDDLFFKQTVQSHPPSLLKPKIRTQRKIEWAKKFLLSKVNSEIGASTPQTAISFLRELRQVLISDLVVACIPVTSQKQAFKIFETLNHRGLKLAAPDLLLNLLMSAAGSEEDRKTIRALWTEMIEGLGKFDLNDFLRDYWTSKHGDIKTGDLFTVLKEHLDTNQTNPVAFVRECAEECDKYISLVHVDGSQLEEAEPHVRSLLTELSDDAALPLLLSAFGTFSKSEFKTLCAYMLVFITRYGIMGNLNRAGLENSFFRLARETRAKMKAGPNSKDCLAMIRGEFEKNSPQNSQIDVEKFTLSSAEARYVLFKLADYMQGERKELGVTAFTNVEHIFPKSPKENEWGGPENHAKLEKYTDHLGNLTILSRRLNNKIANAEYAAVKRGKYLESKVAMTLEVAQKYPDWNEHLIMDRAHHLAKLAKDIWNYNSLGRV